MNPGLAQAYGFLALRIVALLCGTVMAVLGYLNKDALLGGAGVTMTTTALITMGQDPAHVDKLVKTTAAQAAQAASSTTTISVQKPAAAGDAPK